MRRPVLTLAIAAVLGLALTAGEASACHKKKKCATPCPEPVACVPTPAPCPTPEPVACAPAPKKKCFGGMKMFGHKKNKAACAEMVAYEAAPAYHHAPAPVYSTGQSGHASGQGY